MQQRIIVLGVGILLMLVVSLQVFLIMVGLEAWITFNTGVAWGAAVTSVVLATFSLLLYRYLHRAVVAPPEVRQRRRARQG